MCDQNQTSKNCCRLKHATWLTSPEGMGVLRAKQKLLQHMISDWVRRRHSLVHIACGAGIFLPTLWEQGFDVTALESESHLLDIAQTLMGHKVAWHLGKPEHLPFDDKQFDYTLLTLDFTTGSETLRTIVEEAWRVAGQGILILYTSRCSLFGLSQKYFVKKACAPVCYHPFALRRLAQTCCSDSVYTAKATLLGPKWTWMRNERWLKRLNSAHVTGSFGAFAGLRVDRLLVRPLNPLWLLERNAELHMGSTCTACSTGVKRELFLAE